MVQNGLKMDRKLFEIVNMVQNGPKYWFMVKNSPSVVGLSEILGLFFFRAGFHRVKCGVLEDWRTIRLSGAPLLPAGYQGRHAD